LHVASKLHDLAPQFVQQPNQFVAMRMTVIVFAVAVSVLVVLAIVSRSFTAFPFSAFTITVAPFTVAAISIASFKVAAFSITLSVTFAPFAFAIIFLAVDSDGFDKNAAALLSDLHVVATQSAHENAVLDTIEEFRKGHIDGHAVAVQHKLGKIDSMFTHLSVNA